MIGSESENVIIVNLIKEGSRIINLGIFNTKNYLFVKFRCIQKSLEQKKTPICIGVLVIERKLVSSFIFNFGFFTSKLSEIENSCSTNCTFFVDFNFL